MAHAPKSLLADETPVVGTRSERTYLKNAQKSLPQMEGETPRAVFRGSTGTIWWLMLPFPLSIPIIVYNIFMKRQRMVVVTDRRVHIFPPGSTKRGMRKKAVTLDRPTEVKLTRFGLQLGDARKLYSKIGTSGAMKEVAALAEQPPG